MFVVFITHCILESITISYHTNQITKDEMLQLTETLSNKAEGNKSPSETITVTVNVSVPARRERICFSADSEVSADLISQDRTEQRVGCTGH